MHRQGQVEQLSKSRKKFLAHVQALYPNYIVEAKEYKFENCLEDINT